MVLIDDKVLLSSLDMSFVRVEHRLRWMQFVDGENLAIRAKRVALDSRRTIPPGPNYRPDCFYWPTRRGNQALTFYRGNMPLMEDAALRAFYYTSVPGAENDRLEVRDALKIIGFQPMVFKRGKRQRQNGNADELDDPIRSKQVDIQLATDVLSNAFRNNYDAAVLVAGDGDYVPLVEEVKRLGKLVYVFFFRNGLSKDLLNAADGFSDITEEFLKLTLPH